METQSNHHHWPGLPNDFIDHLQQVCPENFQQSTFASFSQTKTISFRVNQLLANETDVINSLRSEGLSPDPIGFFVDSNISAWRVPGKDRSLLTHSQAANEGQIYIQGLSSMFAPALLAPQPEDTVLDLAAAPGGKTILMAELMGNKGTVSAVEPVKGRFFKLQANLQRCGVSNTRTYLKDGRAVGNLKPDFFDSVLLDAPCSSEARIRAGEPDSYKHWSLSKVKECARKQKRLILSAFKSLKPGGKLLYSTCSFAIEENEVVVNSLLKKHSDAVIIPISLDYPQATGGLIQNGKKMLHPELEKTCRIWPNEEVDGFYLALIEKQKQK